MAQREWVEKDFYKELGVSSDASQKEIKNAYRKLLPNSIRTRTRLAPNGSRRFPRHIASCRTRPSARSTTKPDGCSPAAGSAAADSAAAAATSADSVGMASSSI